QPVTQQVSVQGQRSRRRIGAAAGWHFVTAVKTDGKLHCALRLRVRQREQREHQDEKRSRTHQFLYFGLRRYQISAPAPSKSNQITDGSGTSRICPRTWPFGCPAD